MKKDEMVVCVACGAVNRLPSGKNSLAGRCGKCGEKLFSGTPAPVGTAMFDRLVSKGTLPVIVDIWAPWCGPCRTMAPEFQKATQVLEPRARFVKIDSDSEQQLASR